MEFIDREIFREGFGGLIKKIDGVEECLIELSGDYGDRIMKIATSVLPAIITSNSYKLRETDVKIAVDYAKLLLAACSEEQSKLDRSRKLKSSDQEDAE